MKNIHKFFTSFIFLSVILITVISCDEDFITVESDINGTQNFEVDKIEYQIVSYTQRISDIISGVQSNGLSSNLLGVYPDPNTVFGTTEAEIITQVTPTVFDVDFGNNATLKDVILNIPYFSRITNSEANGSSTYELDSIFGNPDAFFSLSIHKSNYLLRDLDPDTNFEETQKYYSSQEALFNAQIGEELYSNNFFQPNADEIVINELDDTGAPVIGDDGAPIVIERLAPAIRVSLSDLNPTIWENLFLNNSDSEAFSNANNFKDFFRGLIFQVGQVNDDGVMAMLDFSAGNISINYTNETVNEDGETIVNDLSYVLNISGNRVNTFNNLNTTYTTGDMVNGDDQLFLKGGDGAFTVVELFSSVDSDNNGLSDDFEDFKSKKGNLLINEVNLTFYVDQDNVIGDEPDRILIYDLKNNTPIIDYLIDGTTSLTDPLNSNRYHSERLEKDNDGKGIKYKFRLTEHINNLLLGDDTENVKIGLFVSTNVNDVISQQVEGVAEDEDDSTIDKIPSSSVLSPKGTILHGSTSSVPENLRAKFEIFYTEPQN